MLKKCNCGSGELSWWAKDAQGIELARVCGVCEEEKLARFRPEILTGYDQSDVDEPIESDDAIDRSIADYHLNTTMAGRQIAARQEGQSIGVATYDDDGFRIDSHYDPEYGTDC